jgi:Electron transfer DM13
MNRRLLLALGAIVVAGGWYAFRPERLFVNQRVNESFGAMATDAAAGRAVAAGQFHSNAHETKGTASIHQLADGQRVLRLTDFATSNGPDVRVYLVAAADVQDNETVKTAGFVEVGALKGNIGDQNYEVPAGVDLTRYRAVTIWCRRFGVNFGTAPLTPGT